LGTDRALSGSFSADLYRTFHSAIAAALGRLGIRAGERGRQALASDTGNPDYCFARSVPIDVEAGGRKIAGSAQRRRGNRILMHGSIFLTPNRLVPMAASACAAAGREVGYREFADLFIESVRDVLDVDFQKDTLSSEEIKYAKKTSAEKYGARWWTQKR
jgi:lipoate-protein ligase A